MKSLKPTIVLVGLMGAGKSRVGAVLAGMLGLPFADSDREIEKAAGMSVAEIFETLGEKNFRDGERRVIQRLLTDGRAKVLASGGGAFIQEDVRRAIKRHAVSVWLKADLETLVSRTGRSQRRPLLAQGDRKEKLRELMDIRYPVYAEADVTVVTDDSAPEETAARICATLRAQDDGGFLPEDAA